MQRFYPVADATKAANYFGKLDGGYYLDGSDLHREWFGKGAERLGLSNPPDFEQFKKLIHGLDPNSGGQLTAKLIDNRIPAWDITSSVPKGVTTALESGDDRIHDALWAANREAMADLETYITTRVRKGGKQDDRVTGNLVCFSVEHPETRPNKEDGMPDWDRHIHNVVMNLTYDQAEGEWKAIKFRPIMDMRKFFDRSFDLRLSSKLADLGYEIEPRWKADEKGGRKYFSWDIKGIPDSVVKKFSRRSGEVEELADRLGIDDPTRKDKLGATSRQFKRKDMTLDDFRAYWNSRITPEEGQEISKTILEAMSGKNPKREPEVAKAVTYALGHHFERRSVVDWTDLAVTAMERSMGAGLPGEILPEALRQGVLLKDGEATTRNVLAEEARTIAFARDGRGTCRAMEAEGTITVEELTGKKAGNLLLTFPSGQSFEVSKEQFGITRHVLESPDRVIMIRGAAGTGKTHTMKATIAGLDRPVVVLAPSAEASRKVLRDEGFAEADTVARFLIDEKFQQKAKGGVIWVDEAGLLGIRQVAQVFEVAKELGARVVLQGDKKQHASVERGATLRVLEEFAGLTVAELKDIRRQSGDYKKAVKSLADGKMLAGFDKLVDLGWVKETNVVDHNKPLVDDFIDALNLKKAKQEVSDRVIVVAPTHAEGDEITAEIREKLKELGIVAKDEKSIQTLVPLHWTDAEKGDDVRYDGTEVMQFHRNSGSFRAGDRLCVSDRKDGDSYKSPAHFSVYSKGQIEVAAGDTIRITSNGKTKDEKHKLNNGATYQVTGFTKDGDIVLKNKWVIAKDFGHIAHGYVTTSHASQGKTVDRVLIAMGNESLGAINAEQFYVSVSRGRESARIYTDMPTGLREAIQRSDKRKSATELMGPGRAKPNTDRRKKFMERVRDFYDELRERAFDVMNRLDKQKEIEVSRGRD